MYQQNKRAVSLADWAVSRDLKEDRHLMEIRTPETRDQLHALQLGQCRVVKPEGKKEACDSASDFLVSDFRAWM